MLTDGERARLRPTVNLRALERFLAEIPEEVRPGVQSAIVLHFSRAVTMADIRDFFASVGNDDAAAAMDRAAAAEARESPPPRPQLADKPEVAADATGAADQIFTMEPPESPRLRALWDAIEPPPS